MSAEIQQTELPLSWIRQIPGDLFHLDEKPLLGFAPDFAWQSFIELIGESFHLNNVTIKNSVWEWRSTQQLLDGLGHDALGLSFSIAPLAGSGWCVMPTLEFSSLMGTLLSQEGVFSEQDIDPDFFSAFHRFIAVETLNAFEKIHEDKKLSVSVGQQSLPKEACLSSDVTISFGSTLLHCRLFLSPELRKSWSTHYTQPTKALFHLSPVSNNLDVIIHLEAGKVDLKLSDWKKIKVADFLFLDSCSLDVDEDKGRVSLTINGIPYFRGKIKQGSLKILEHPLYHEVNPVSEPTNEHDTDDLFDDSEFDADTSGDDTSTTSEFDTQEDTSTTSEFEIDDTDLSSSELILDDSDGLTTQHDSSTETMHDTVAAKESSAEHNVPIQPNANAPLAPEDITLPIIVEVARIQMSIKKLMELQPGNMLELNVHPESGVDLVVHGKRIARGELLRVGDALGIRILELS